MVQFTDHFFFEIRMTGPDGSPIPATRHWTVQEAMSEAANYSGATGGIWYHGEAGPQPVQTLIYGADGSIEVNHAVPGDS